MVHFVSRTCVAIESQDTGKESGEGIGIQRIWLRVRMERGLGRRMVKEVSSMGRETRVFISYPCKGSKKGLESNPVK